MDLHAKEQANKSIMDDKIIWLYYIPHPALWLLTLYLTQPCGSLLYTSRSHVAPYFTPHTALWFLTFYHTQPCGSLLYTSRSPVAPYFIPHATLWLLTLYLTQPCGSLLYTSRSPVASVLGIDDALILMSYPPPETQLL